jgi:hypothetical protein
MAYDLPFLDNKTQRNLSRQISGLARDAGQITNQIARFTDHAKRDATQYAQHIADDAWEQGTAVAKVVGKQAAKAGKAFSRDPLPAVIAAAGLACLLALVLTSGRGHRR